MAPRKNTTTKTKKDKNKEIDNLIDTVNNDILATSSSVPVDASNYDDVMNKQNPSISPLFTFNIVRKYDNFDNDIEKLANNGSCENTPFNIYKVVKDYDHFDLFVIEEILDYFVDFLNKLVPHKIDDLFVDQPHAKNLIDYNKFEKFNHNLYICKYIPPFYIQWLFSKLSHVLTNYKHQNGYVLFQFRFNCLCDCYKNTSDYNLYSTDFKNLKKFNCNDINLLKLDDIMNICNINAVLITQ